MKWVVGCVRRGTEQGNGNYSCLSYVSVLLRPYLSVKHLKLEHKININITTNFLIKKRPLTIPEANCDGRGWRTRSERCITSPPEVHKSTRTW